VCVSLMTELLFIDSNLVPRPAAFLYTVTVYLVLFVLADLYI